MASQEYKQYLMREQSAEPVSATVHTQKKPFPWKSVIIAIVVILLAVSVLVDCIKLRQVKKPDLQIAYVAASRLPEEQLEALREIFVYFGQDINQDGAVTVQINQYTDLDSADYYSGQIQLITDLQSNQSFIFLLDDPVSFQQNHIALAPLDGSEPREAVEDASLIAFDLSSLQAPEALQQQFDTLKGLEHLYLARRYIYTEYTDAPTQLGEWIQWWERLTQSTDNKN